MSDSRSPKKAALIIRPLQIQSAGPGPEDRHNKLVNSMARYKLSVMPAAWGLPTFHPECLSSFAYIKLSGIDSQVVPISATAAAQFGKLVCRSQRVKS